LTYTITCFDAIAKAPAGTAADSRWGCYPLTPIRHRYQMGPINVLDVGAGSD
jgi:hypothetical protein